MWVGNLILVILNLPLIGIWVRMLTVPYKYLFPSILTFGTIATFTLAYASFDVYVMAAFGLLGCRQPQQHIEEIPRYYFERTEECGFCAEP